MTTAELIARLQTFDPASQVVVDGFDGWGFDPVETVREITLVPVAPRSHSPEFEEPDRLTNGAEVTGEPFNAVFLHWREE